MWLAALMSKHKPFLEGSKTNVLGQVEIRPTVRFIEGSNLVRALESDGPISGLWQGLSLPSGGQPDLYPSRLPTLPSWYPRMTATALTELPLPRSVVSSIFWNHSKSQVLSVWSGFS